MKNLSGLFSFVGLGLITIGGIGLGATGSGDLPEELIIPSVIVILAGVVSLVISWRQNK